MSMPYTPGYPSAAYTHMTTGGIPGYCGVGIPVPLPTSELTPNIDKMEGINEMYGSLENEYGSSTLGCCRDPELGFDPDLVGAVTDHPSPSQLLYSTLQVSTSHNIPAQLGSPPSYPFPTNRLNVLLRRWSETADQKELCSYRKIMPRPEVKPQQDVIVRGHVSKLQDMSHIRQASAQKLYSHQETNPTEKPLYLQLPPEPGMPNQRGPPANNQISSQHQQNVPLMTESYTDLLFSTLPDLLPTGFHANRQLAPEADAPVQRDFYANYQVSAQQDSSSIGETFANFLFSPQPDITTTKEFYTNQKFSPEQEVPIKQDFTSLRELFPELDTSAHEQWPSIPLPEPLQEAPQFPPQPAPGRVTFRKSATGHPNWHTANEFVFNFNLLNAPVPHLEWVLEWNSFYLENNIPHNARTAVNPDRSRYFSFSPMEPGIEEEEQNLAEVGVNTDYMIHSQWSRDARPDTPPPAPPSERLEQGGEKLSEVTVEQSLEDKKERAEKLSIVQTRLAKQREGRRRSRRLVKAEGV